MKPGFLLSAIALLLFSCQSNKQADYVNDGTSIDTITGNHIPQMKYYISENYAICLSEHLPCTCIVGNGGACQVIALDKDNSKNFIGYDRNSDIDAGFARVEEEKGSFNVYIYDTSTSPYFSYSLVADTLYLNKKGNKYKYISYYQSEYDEDFLTFIYKYNHYRLVELLNAKGFDIKQKLGYTDSTALFCNNDMEYHNLLFQYKKDGNDWFIEEDARHFYVYKWADTVKMKRIHYEEYPKQLLYTIKK